MATGVAVITASAAAFGYETFLVTVTPVVLTGLAGLVGVLSSYIATRQRAKSMTPEEAAEKDIEALVMRRLKEAKAELEQQESIAARNRLISGALIGGQYVLGAALATSFVTQSLAGKTVSFFGVIVVVAQVIRQHTTHRQPFPLLSKRCPCYGGLSAERRMP